MASNDPRKHHVINRLPAYSYGPSKHGDPSDHPRCCNLCEQADVQPGTSRCTACRIITQ